MYERYVFRILWEYVCGLPMSTDCVNLAHVIEGSLKVKLPTIWTDEKHSQEEAEPGRNSDVEKVRREKIRDGESQKKEDAGV